MLARLWEMVRDGEMWPEECGLRRVARDGVTGNCGCESWEKAVRDMVRSDLYTNQLN